MFERFVFTHAVRGVVSDSLLMDHLASHWGEGTLYKIESGPELFQALGDICGWFDDNGELLTFEETYDLSDED